MPPAPLPEPELLPLLDDTDIISPPELIQPEIVEDINFPDSADAIIFEGEINDVTGPDQLYRGSKNIPQADAEFVYTPRMVQEIKRCKEDIVYFAENYFTITNVDRGKEKINLYGAQRRVLKSLMRERFVSLLSCRQSGKCFSYEGVIEVRNKKTGVIEAITVGEFLKRIKLSVD